MQRTYGTAKLVIAVLEISGWTAVALGLIGAAYYYQYNGNIAIAAGLATSAFGLLKVAVAQMALAQISTAEYTGAMLELMRQDRARTTSATRVEPPLTLGRVPSRD